ncbi:MAG: hypothetical protein ACLQU3_22360 [Limisphaerales bacterium]
MSIKTKTNRTNRIKKQAGNGVNSLQSLEATLLAHQMSEAAGKQVTTKPRSIEGQSGEAPLSTEQTTIIQAKTDVGFGNSLFIRGQGAGLSWEKGLPLNCIDESVWVWSTNQAQGRIVFKLLLNDQVWAKGEDVVVEAGRKIEIVPVF